MCCEVQDPRVRLPADFPRVPILLPLIVPALLEYQADIYGHITSSKILRNNNNNNSSKFLSTPNSSFDSYAVRWETCNLQFHELEVG
jgi:hypothetical protein